VFEQRRVAGRLRGEGYSWAQIAHTLREQYKLNGFAAVRQAHSWTQQQAAEEWCRRWPDDPITQKTISAWETWEGNRRGTPSLHRLARLAQIYEVTASDLLAGWADFRPVLPAAERSRYPVDVNRRQFIGLGSLALSALPLPAGKQLPRIGASDLAVLETNLLALWHADEARGGAAVYQDVCSQLVAVRELRERTTYGSTVGRGLLVVPGTLDELAGFTAYDAGDHSTAQAHFHAALRTARVADDNELATYVMAQLANQASYLGHGVEVVELTEAAQRISHSFARPRLIAVLSSREAEGHALRGDARAASEALGRAESELADAGDDGDEWFAYFTPEMLAASKGRTWLALGAPAAAERATSDSVGGGLARRPLALNHVEHAGALIASGQLDHAAAVTVETVKLGQDVASGRLRRALTSLRPAFEGHEANAQVAVALDALGNF
jgi:transcriptional regulator with XRE-family HTH domain